MDREDIRIAVMRTRDAEAELRRQGTPAGDALIMAGLALGVLLAGDRGNT
jgi:hypothetical protein